MAVRPRNAAPYLSRKGGSFPPSEASVPLVVSSGRTVKMDKDALLSRFNPEVVQFLEDNLGLDLNEQDVSVLHDLLSGKFTKPLSLTVSPIVYDKDGKTECVADPIVVKVSLRTIFHYEKGRMLGPGEDGKGVLISTVPCRPYVSAGTALPAEEQKTEKKVVFTEKQKQALESVGIQRSRLYEGFNALSASQRSAIVAGEEFFVEGAVRTSFGYVNICGTAYLKDGFPAIKFIPCDEPHPQKGETIDLWGAHIIGGLELDLFKRNDDGSLALDKKGRPVPNQAGENLLRFGMAMEPVKGVMHTRSYNHHKGKDVSAETVSEDLYQVCALNGSLYACRMVEDKVPYVRLDSEGRVFVDGKADGPLEFVSDADREEYIKGRGGLVKGARYYDRNTRQTTLYDAFVVPDATRAGFAKQYTPKSTQAILDMRAGKKAAYRKSFSFKRNAFLSRKF